MTSGDYEKGQVYYMRVISGSARGRKLYSPSGNDVRPTTDTVKESVFSIIQFDIEGCRFLDAFAGSGQMGIEALSRGADKAFFVDSSRRSMEIIRKNISLCGFGADKAVTVCRDTISYISGTEERFDIAFLDPPYKTGLVQSAFELCTRITDKLIICEHPSDETLPERSGKFILKKKYKYGTITVSLYVCSESQGI